MTVRKGPFVADYIEGRSEPLSEEAVQPNGVDLTVHAVYEVSGQQVLRDDDYEMQRSEVTPSDGYYELDAGSYVVEYGEKIKIPENHTGFVYPRSRLMRCGANLETAVWDAGYEGIGEGGLRVGAPVKIETGMRVAQIVFVETEALDELYDGSHQGERLDTDE